MKANITRDGAIRLTAENEAENYLMHMWDQEHNDGASVRFSLGVVRNGNVENEIIEIRFKKAQVDQNG